MSLTIIAAVKALAMTYTIATHIGTTAVQNRPNIETLGTQMELRMTTLCRRNSIAKNGAYLDHNCSDWQPSDSESEEELKGWSYEEYRRLKRQKMRKMLKHCIWNVMPSSPWRDTNNLEDYNKFDEIFDRDDVVGKIDKEVKSRRKFESDSDSKYERFASRKRFNGSSRSKV
ncbi:hypothetical protein CR513_22876, partial [Mucuna pruriens]